MTLRPHMGRRERRGDDGGEGRNLEAAEVAQRRNRRICVPGLDPVSPETRVQHCGRFRIKSGNKRGG